MGVVLDGLRLQVVGYTVWMAPHDVAQRGPETYRETGSSSAE